MKKLLLILYFFVFAIFTAQISYAREDSDATKSAKVEYNLAYPGILPDHPFYKIKVLRDKILAFLISDPKKKVDFYLLQADKGILATAMLVDKNNIKLAKETLLKAEHNYTLLTYELRKLEKKPDSDFFKELETASLKHQEVIGSLIERVPDEEQKVFETVLNFSKTNLQSVEKYKKQKALNSK